MTAPRSPRYIALLVSIAILVLLVGALLRPNKPPPAVQANELVTLPELSQRRMLRDVAEYLDERARAFASSVVRLDSLNASGLVIGRDSVLTAFRRTAGEGLSPQLMLTPPPQGDSLPPATRPGSRDSLPAGPRWALVVGRTSEGTPLVISGLIGGSAPLQCGPLALQELVFNAAVPLELQGAGVFDLDGNALGLTVPCESRIALVPLADALDALERPGLP